MKFVNLPPQKKKRNFKKGKTAEKKKPGWPRKKESARGKLGKGVLSDQRRRGKNSPKKQRKVGGGRRMSGTTGACPADQKKGERGSIPKGRKKRKGGHPYRSWEKKKGGGNEHLGKG